MIKSILRFLKISALVAVIGFLGWGLFNLGKQSRDLETKMKDLQITATAFEKENKTIKDNLEYYSHPENLLKELKSLFNYRQPEEKMMIIIPGKNETNENN